MQLTFLGATRTVTGSSFLVSVGDRRVMVDCGLYQGLPKLQERNYTHPAVDWSEVDAILLTHAHIDHCGLVPRAVRLGFQGGIYSHPATIDLAEIMLRDSAEIHEQDAKWLNRKRLRAGKEPVEALFDLKDVADALALLKGVKYGERFEVVPGIIAEFRDAGHILGSASIALDCVEGDLKRRVVFSGDVGHHQAPILREPHGFENADAVLIETTYGNRLHETPIDRWSKLKEIINQAFSDGGKVVIPAFTVGRTQELLYILSEMMVKDEIADIPIYLDSPMAVAATGVHEKHPECFDRETLDRIKSGDNPFKPSTLKFSHSVKDSRAINRHRGSAVIIAGGGMCVGGRIVHHLKHTLYSSRNHIVFVGYQAEGTLGRVILRGKKKVRLFGEEIAVKAKITAIGAFSAHADKDGLIDWLGNFNEPPGLVFLVHGEEHASMDFGETVRNKLGFQTYLPRLGQEVDLSDLDEVALGKRRFVRFPTPKAKDVKEIVARVSILGQEFREMTENYALELSGRIKRTESTGRDPHWRTQDVAELLLHLSEMVGGDLDQLDSMMDLPSPGEGQQDG